MESQSDVISGTPDLTKTRPLQAQSLSHCTSIIKVPVAPFSGDGSLFPFREAPFFLIYYSRSSVFSNLRFRRYIASLMPGVSDIDLPICLYSVGTHRAILFYCFSVYPFFLLKGKLLKFYSLVLDQWQGTLLLYC